MNWYIVLLTCLGLLILAAAWLPPLLRRLSALPRQLGDQPADGGVQMNNETPRCEAGSLARPFG